jgi:excisionase family DNA binding protein
MVCLSFSPRKGKIDAPNGPMYTCGMKNVPPDYLTTMQAAARLGLSVQRVNVLLKTGRIPFTLLNGHRAINRHDLEKFASIKRPAGQPRQD